MAAKFKLDDNGICQSCENVSAPLEHVVCFSCKNLFHVVCNKSSLEERPATKTMVAGFLNKSTKGNFKFFCDTCATNLETSLADTDSQRINLMENQINSINKKLEELMKVMESGRRLESSAEPNKTDVPSSSIWNDPERLATVKAPPTDAALVIQTNQDKQIETNNRCIIEKTLLENSIPLKDSFTNQAGELVLLCQSAEERDELRNLVRTAKEDIDLSTPKERKCNITIVGLMREYTGEEVIQLLLKNDLIKRFANSNDMSEHIQVHSVRQLKNKQEYYQAFATVSQVLREGISKLSNKLVMGITSCKVYDRKLVNRCFNCQKFGHFSSHCPTPQAPSCSRCGGNHSTRTCTSNATSCINCKRANLEHSSHSASHHACPALAKYEEQQKKPLNSRQPAVRTRR